MPEDRLDEGEVQRFVKSLDQWAETLDARERALLQIVLERAAGGGLERAEEIDLSFPESGKLGEIVAPFLQDIATSGALGVRTGGAGTEGIPDLEAREQEAEQVVAGRPVVKVGQGWINGA